MLAFGIGLGIGLLAGWLASLVLGVAGGRAWLNLILGLAGALAAGLILNRGAIGTSTGFGQAAEDRRSERERRLAADSIPFAPGAFATPQAKRAG